MKSKMAKCFAPFMEISFGCLSIQLLISSRSRLDFIADKVAVRKVRRHLRTIRKEARSIPDSFKESHPEVEWRRFDSIRMVFFHEHFGIDVDMVWVIFNEVIAAIAGDMRGVMDTENGKWKMENGTQGNKDRVPSEL